MKRFFVSCSAMILLVSAAAQASGRLSIFQKLAAIEEQGAMARQNASAVQSELETTDVRIQALEREVSVAARAARPIRDELSKTMKNWFAALHAPGPTSWEQRDTAYLLGHASSKALKPKLTNIGLLELADVHRATLSYAVAERVTLSVDLAQAKASVETSGAQRKSLLKSAASDSSVREDLAHTDEALHASISRMLKNDSTLDFHKYKGTLVPPVSGQPDVAFGPRSTGANNTTVRHTGLTWKIPVGSPVRATAGGLVVFAHTFEGYGNLIIIDHGGGYHSLYAHLSTIDVKTGDRVQKAGALGKSGDTGSLEGPKLYFELRQNGRAQDPQEWFLRK